MLVPKPRYFFSLSVAGSLFALALSSCDGSIITNDGVGGSSFSVAGSRAIAGSAGTPVVVASGGQSVVTSGGSGSNPTGAGGGFALGGAGGVSSSGGTGGMAPPCTDIQNPDHASEPCSIWPEYDAANPPSMAKNCGASWLTGAGYCLKSCGICKDATGSSGGNGAGGGGSGGS